jgi:large subunit ribosomal protein L29
VKETKELRPLDDEQLATLLTDVSKKLFMLRFQQTTEKVKSTADFQKLRRQIARIKTLQREREIAGAKNQAKAKP